MSCSRIRIATRKSPLAIWQAEFIKQKLQLLYPSLTVDILGMTTEGDRRLETSLSKVGGKGLFIKELEHALLHNEADIAVHSMKDMTVHLPENLGIAAICERAEVEDAFVSNHYQSLDDLPEGACVGTSSLRRQTLLNAHYPNLTIKTLRGNVNTRLRKLDANEFDAIILAVAGLKRLEFDSRIRAVLATEHFVPAIGQGTIGIECCTDNAAVWELLQALEHPMSRTRLTAERAINEKLNGGCSVPIAGFARIEGKQLRVQGLVGEPDGSRILIAEQQGDLEQAQELGLQVGEDLLAQGAEDILRKYR